MAETIPEWRKRWDEECPLVIGVAYSGWESGSDADLRDELKRIRNVGFTAVRVHFDREGDIEKMAGMMNWRNPDRFFDAAEKADLKVLAAPSNLPHSSLGLNDTQPRPFPDEAVNNVTAWIRRFVSQYRDHPALLAWIIEVDKKAGFETSQERYIYHGLLQQAFAAADFSHPALHLYSTRTTNPLSLNAAAASQEDTLTGSDEKQSNRPDSDLSPENTVLACTSIRLLADLRSSRSPIIRELTGGSFFDTRSHPPLLTSGAITRLLLIQLAAGVQGIVLPQWQSPRRGSQVGKSSMLDWLDRVTPAAQSAGAIARAAADYHQELWYAASTPQVHILCSRRNDDFHARLYRQAAPLQASPSSPELARMGAARVLLNANIPFAFLSDEPRISEQSPLAPILFLPSMESLSESLLLELKEYAANGGRVVADMPTGYLNEKIELLDTRPGSPFEQLFGASVAGLFCFSNLATKDSEPPHGQQRAILVVTTARAGGGKDETPAFTENRVGKGRAVLVNLSLSRLNAAPNLQNAQLSLLSYILGSKQTALPGLTNCLIFRRTSEQAEHVFLVNDSGEERTVEITVTPPFTQAQDAITKEKLSVENNAVSVIVPAGSGRWLRLAK